MHLQNMIMYLIVYRQIKSTRLHQAGAELPLSKNL